MNLTSEGIWLLTSSSNGLQTNFGRLKRDSNYYKITENVCWLKLYVSANTSKNDDRCFVNECLLTLTRT